MTKLERLGVETIYDRDTQNTHYSINIDTKKLTSPKNDEEYFKSVLNAIAKHADDNNSLDNITISVDGKYLGRLQATNKELLEEAENRRGIVKSFGKLPAPSKGLIYGGAVVGGLAGLVLGYDSVTEGMTNLATSLNNYSHLLAPVTGLIQTTTSVLGTMGTTAVGIILGAGGGAILGLPYTARKAPLTSKTKKRYESLESALSQLSQA